MTVPAAGTPSEAVSIGRQTPSTNVDFPASAIGAASLQCIAEKSPCTNSSNNPDTSLVQTADMNTINMIGSNSENIPQVQTVLTTSNQVETGSGTGVTLQRTASCADIHIGLETDNGEAAPVEIDDNNEDDKAGKENEMTGDTLSTGNIVNHGEQDQKVVVLGSD